jgi:hypothetical protein
MIPVGAMVTKGVCEMYYQHYIILISLVQKGEIIQRKQDTGSNPKRRMALFH